MVYAIPPPHADDRLGTGAAAVGCPVVWKAVHLRILHRVFDSRHCGAERVAMFRFTIRDVLWLMLVGGAGHQQRKNALAANGDGRSLTEKTPRAVNVVSLLLIWHPCRLSKCVAANAPV